MVIPRGLLFVLNRVLKEIVLLYNIELTGLFAVLSLNVGLGEERLGQLGHLTD
jgi:hypothetical protein